MSAVAKKATGDERMSNLRKNKTSNVYLAISNASCSFCKEKHQIFKCFNFLKLPIEDRNKEVPNDYV